jgi:hypothetical protein
VIKATTMPMAKESCTIVDRLWEKVQVCVQAGLASVEDRLEKGRGLVRFNPQCEADAPILEQHERPHCPWIFAVSALSLPLADYRRSRTQIS